MKHYRNRHPIVICRTRLLLKMRAEKCGMGADLMQYMTGQNWLVPPAYITTHETNRHLLCSFMIKLVKRLAGGIP